MEFVFRPVALVGLLAGLVAWALALFVYFARPHRSQNRRLAIVLFVEGAAVGAGMGLMYMMREEADAYGWQAAATIATLVLPLLYLWFVTTLDTPLVRPLTSPVAQRLLEALVLAAGALWFLAPENFIEPRLEPTWYAQWESSPGPWNPARLFLSIAIYLFAFAAALSAFLRAPVGSGARMRAKAFAIAFGSRDLLLGLIYSLRFVLERGTHAYDLVGILSRPFVTLLMVTLVAYGILRTQLFDIHIRIKWTLRRGTLAATFVAVFFIVGQTAQNLLSEEFGWALGGIAAGLLFFAINPLQRFAERFSNFAMPRTKTHAEFTPDERSAIYLEQARLAWEDGKLRPQERELLENLRTRLGLSPEQAHRIEGDVLPGRRGRPRTRSPLPTA